MSINKLIIIIIVVVVALLCILKYNTIAGYDEQVENAWSPLVSALDQRYDGVPKLVNEIILYTQHEDDATRALSQAEKKFDAASGMVAKVEAADDLEAQLSKVYIEAGQRYPGITSHYQFQALKENFEQSGKEMAQSMQGYNKAVEQYNTYARKFPNNLVALIMGFHHSYPYFKREGN